MNSHIHTTDGEILEIPDSITPASLSRYRQKHLLQEITKQELPPGGVLPNLKYIKSHVQNMKTEIPTIHRPKVTRIELLIDEMITTLNS